MIETKIVNSKICYSFELVNRTKSKVGLSFLTYRFGLMMRSFLAFLFLLMAQPSYSEPEAAYLILKSTLVEGETPPTWICLARLRRCTHIPANKDIVSIKPGKYVIAHVDISKSKHFGSGTQFFGKPMRLNLEAGSIYFIGNYKFKKAGLGKYKIELDQSINLLSQACASRPEIFKKYSVSNVQNSEKFRINCHDVKN